MIEADKTAPSNFPRSMNRTFTSAVSTPLPVPQIVIKDEQEF